MTLTAPNPNQDRTEDVTFRSETNRKQGDYLTLNAQLNLWATDENGNPLRDEEGNKVIQLDKDREAAKAYFLDHVNPNTQWFTNLEEKLRYLVENEYYEKEFIEKYDMTFIKELFKQVYAENFRFPSFVGAYKYYTSYTLRTFDGRRYLERFEDRVTVTALYLADGDKKFAKQLAAEMISGRFQPATPTFLNSGKAQRGELVSCFEAGTPVATINGNVPIEKIQAGDMVLTHDGTYSKVLTTGSRMETKALYTLSMHGSPASLTATPEHPVLVKRGKTSPIIDSVHEGDGAGNGLIWVRMDQVEAGDMIVVSRNLEPALKTEIRLLEHVNNYEYAWGRSYIEAEENFLRIGSIDVKNNRNKESSFSQQSSAIKDTVELNYDFGRFVGYYLSEGYVHRNNKATKGLRFTFGTKEVEYIEDVSQLGTKLFGVNPVINENKDGSTNVAFWSAGLGNLFVDIIGTGFDRKILPEYMVQAPNDFIYGMLIGAFRGDGCTTKGKMVMDLSNPALINQLKEAALRIGVLPYVRNYISQSGSPTASLVINNSTSENLALIADVNKNVHMLGKTPTSPRKNFFAWVNGQAVYRVKATTSTELVAPTKVYNLEVAEKHTYVANGYVVHNCFLLDVQDDLNSIGRAINSALQLSKKGGGVALNLSNLRAKGDPIKKIENQSSGVVPVMKLLEDSFSYANQLGARQGAGAVYLNAHHPDIMQFLDTKRENADEKIRIKTLSLGVVIPDITMELMRNNEDMYLFSPYDVEREYGKQFSYVNITENYRDMVENPRIKKTKINPRHFFQTLAEIQMESGYPYILFEDAANRANPVSGKIIMSNLCSEILQPQEPSTIRGDQTFEVLGKDISCNLGSLNVKRALESPDFGKTIETAIRALTQVSDMSNITEVPTVQSGNKRSHAIGIGAMNLHGAFGHYEMYYGDEESLDLTNVYYSAVTYYAILASNKIAKEKKETFDGFEKSKYATGEYFTKYIENVAIPQTAKVKEIFKDIAIPTAEDWEKLSASVQKHGIYNQNLAATPPTGSISFVNNSTASIHPIASKIEARKEARLGSVYYPSPEMTTSNQKYFQDAYEIGPEKLMDVYSVAGFYVDQGLSLTLFFKDTATTKDINKAQIYAFSKGKRTPKTERGEMLSKYPQGELKTMYYIRLQAQVMNGIEMEECVSCSL